MKKFLVLLLAFASLNVLAQNDVFVLDPQQSMLMTGKGIGQDGAINPYFGEESIAIIENLGKSTFSVRIQEKGTIKKEISISAREEKQIMLGSNEELYIDTSMKTKLRINFKPIEN